MLGKSFKAGTLIRALLIGFWVVLIAPGALADQNNTPVILVFGDSLSAAYRMEESQGWVALLQQRLRERDYAHHVVNGSVSGETTGGGLARLPAQLAGSEPDIVILELGGNDGLRGLPVAAIRSNLQEMIELSQQAGARVLLVGIQIPPNYGPRYTEPFYAQYQELAEQYGTELIPFLLDGIADHPQWMQDDGIHPTAEAQPMIVDIVWPVLESML
ncbi:arylesterase [Pseudohongiella spirulinae]|nr:arylesterase [Pseudohongiella spirulinae]